MRNKNLYINFTKNAYNMIYDYEIFPVQFEFNLPTLEVLMAMLDWNVISDLQESY